MVHTWVIINTPSLAKALHLCCPLDTKQKANRGGTIVHWCYLGGDTWFVFEDSEELSKPLCGSSSDASGFVCKTHA